MLDSCHHHLGLDEQVSGTEPIAPSMLPVLHRTPVWLKSRGWALVNAAVRQLVFTDGDTMPFDDIKEPIYMTPPVFALGLRGTGSPLSIDGILNTGRVWVEPVSTDADLASQLRGWYHPREKRLVENEYGNRFYRDAYGAKWLAFGSCFGE